MIKIQFLKSYIVGTIKFEKGETKYLPEEQAKKLLRQKIVKEVKNG